MEDVVTCPNCGEANPADLPFCQHCQWRLHSFAVESNPDSDADSTIAAPGAASAPSAPKAVPDWLAQPAAPSDSADEESTGRLPRRELPYRGDDLLAGLALQREAEPEDIPEWVARIMGIAPKEVASDEAAADLPTQIRNAAPLETPTPDSEAMDLGASFAAEPADGIVEPNIGHMTEAASIVEPAAEDDNEINQWLRQLDASAARREMASRPRGTAGAQDVPSWVDKMLGVSPTTPRGALREGEALPEWLAEPAQPDRSASMSERAQDYVREDEDTAADAVNVPAVPAPQPSKESPRVVPPFPPEEIHRLDVNAVLDSMQMPDWLADVEGVHNAASDARPGPEDSEPIAQANLPSWIEAMRPVEYESPTGTAVQNEARQEQRGPLLGLHGVLPSVPGAVAPSSRPKSHSIRLETSERQRARAGLLEDLLAAEARPASLAGRAQMVPQGILRWFIGTLMILVVGGAVLSRSRIFPLPAGVPIESNAAIMAVQSIQPGAPVLAVFDYEPATAGEMEATASSLMDHLLLLKHPRLAIISSSATGSALAERFLATVLADRRYSRGSQFVNLGFLPGGLTGVRLFAEDPAAAAPLGAASDRVWDSPVLAGVGRLEDFVAIIVITDSLDSGRVWIEQTQRARGSSRLIVVSSAQSGPMLLPYFNSNQIQGLVAGLNGAAGPELSNNGLPGMVRGYWDAYSLGLYVAASLILGGAVWHASKAARNQHRDLA